MNKSVWFARKTKSDKPTSNLYECWKTFYTDKGGHVENYVSFEFRNDDGFVCISDERGFIFLTPQQISYLADLFETEEADFILKCRNLMDEPNHD